MNAKTTVVTSIAILTAWLFARPPDTLWTKIYGRAEDDRAYSVQQTYDEGYMIAGITQSDVSDYDVWLLRSDVYGDTLWTKTYGGQSRDRAFSMQVTLDGGCIIVGEKNHTYLWLLRTDRFGDTLWSKTYLPPTYLYSLGYSVQITSDGGFIAAGSTTDGWDVTYLWLLRTDENGDTLWTQRYAARDNNYGSSVRETPDGGYMMVGVSRDNFATERSLYLVRTDSDGNPIWTRTFFDSVCYRSYYGLEKLTSVVTTPDSGYIIATTYGDYPCKVLLLKVNANGDSIWVKKYGSSYAGGAGAHYIESTVDDMYIVTGWYMLPSSFESLWILKIDDYGDTLWTTTFGDSCCGFEIRQTNDGGYIVAGTNYCDLWLMKTEPDTLGVLEQKILSLENNYVAPTVFSGPFFLPEGKTCKVFDITGRVIAPDKIRPGIYFIEVDGVITRKVVKVR